MREAETLVRARWAWRALEWRVLVVGVLIVCVGTSGAISINVVELKLVSELAVVSLFFVGLAGLLRMRLPFSLAFPGALFLIVSAVFCIPDLYVSVDFAFRSFLGLTLPVAAASAVVWVCQHSSHPRYARQFIAAALLVVVFANILFGLRQALVGLSSAEIAAAEAADSTYLVGDAIRLPGTFQTNQDFGLFVSCLLPFVFFLALAEQGTRRLVLLSSSACLFLVTLLSLTRTALISSVLSVLLTLLVRRRGVALTRLLHLAVGVGIAALLFSLVVQFASVPRLTEAISRASSIFALATDKSFNARQSSTLPNALAILSDAPLGSGGGSAGPVSQAYDAVSPYGGVVTDNGYLMIAIQLGVLGGLLFISLLLLTLRFLASRHTVISTPAAASLLGLLIAMMTAQYWSLSAAISMVAVTVGLGLAEVASIPTPQKDDRLH